jgi:hypothetical protein
MDTNQHAPPISDLLEAVESLRSCVHELGSDLAAHRLPLIQRGSSFRRLNLAYYLPCVRPTCERCRLN